MYRTGIETKLNIVETAKELFLSRGYKAVTVRRICEHADVKLGTFTYYFSKKDDLLGQLYSAYMQACKSYVDIHAPHGLSPAEHHMYAVMLYYWFLYSDEATVAFHREVLRLAPVDAYFENPRAVLADFSDTGAVDRNDPSYSLLVLADNAVRRELNLDFSGQDERSLDDVRHLLENIYTITARLFGTDRAQLMAYIEHAYGFVRENLDAPLSLLG